jgi:hypothetical protein
LVLTGAAAETAARAGIERLHHALTHTPDVALAQVIAER